MVTNRSNMPRAGILFNDGFGGGSTVTENLGFNTCRESSDHAVFNSWVSQIAVFLQCCYRVVADPPCPRRS